MPANGSATLPHGLNVYSVPLKPDQVTPEFQVFEVDNALTDETNLTVTNTGIVPLDCKFLCEAWHPVERQLGSDSPDDGSFTERLQAPPFVGNQPDPSVSPPIFNGVDKELTNGVAAALIYVDFSAVPDQTFSAKIFYAVECTDGTDSQIVSGECNALVAFKPPATFNTAHAENDNNAKTQGNLTVSIDWLIAGNIATLRVTATSTLVPTELHIHYFVLYATHAAFVYA